MLAALRRVVGATLPLALLLACTPEFPSDPTIADRLCASMCARHVACQPAKWNDTQCRASCLADPEPTKYGGNGRQYYRQDYVDAILHCTEAASCDVVEDEGRYRSQCYADTQPPPSPYATQVCSRLRAKVTECGGNAPRATCTEELGGIRDEVLKGAARCLADQGCGWGIQCWNDWAKTTH